MGFDEELQRTLNGLGDRLREQVAAEVRARLDAARAEQTAVHEAVLAELEQAAQERQAERRAEWERTAATRMDEADRRARAADALAATAAARAEAAEARAASAERARGDAEARAADAQTRLAEAPATRATDELAVAMRTIDEASSLGEILDRLVDGARHDAARAAVLLVGRGCFDGWRFAGFDDGRDEERISVPLVEGGVLADAVRRGGTVHSRGGAIPPTFAGPAGLACLAVPLLVGGQAVAVFYADAGLDHGAREFRPAALEVLARHAGQRLVAMTAFKAARTLAPPSPGTGGPRRTQEEDEEGARRYARLLVSEIRLYHEADVAEGRERRDLGTRLGSEIARARVLYEQRVPPDIRRRADYFHAELVRTLADGDARLLEART